MGALRAAVLIAALLMAVIYASIPCYWLIVHPFADLWRRQRSPFRIILPLWALVITAFVAITWPWHARRLYETPWIWLVSALFFAAGFQVYRRMRSEFGPANLSGQSEISPEASETLVTTGMHARVRHPIYLAHLCIMLAFTIGSGLVVDYVLVLFALITGAVMIVLEERELERRFGDAWHEYKQHTGAILPTRRKSSSVASPREVEAR